MRIYSDVRSCFVGDSYFQMLTLFVSFARVSVGQRCLVFEPRVLVETCERVDCCRHDDDAQQQTHKRTCCTGACHGHVSDGTEQAIMTEFSNGPHR